MSVKLSHSGPLSTCTFSFIFSHVKHLYPVSAFLGMEGILFSTKPGETEGWGVRAHPCVQRPSQKGTGSPARLGS